MNSPPPSKVVFVVFVASLTALTACGTSANKAVVSGGDAATAPGDAVVDARLVFKDEGTGGSANPGDANTAVPDSASSGGTTADARAGKPDAAAAGGTVPPDASAPTDAAQPAPDAAQTPDAAPPPPPPANVCQACAAPADCAALGPGADCSQLIGGTFCTTSCANGEACGDGFRCAFNRCVPAGARCDGCATTPCDPGLRCNLDNGNCEARLGRCTACGNDTDCTDGFGCRPLSFLNVCLAACDAGTPCDAGFHCEAGTCMPDSGICDACGGCVAPTPVCNLLTRMCMECGPGTPCPAGQICAADGTCTAPDPGVDCNADLDCRDPALPHCVESHCVVCRDANDCHAGQICDAGACVDQPCAGIACQSGSACDPASQHCGPGCAVDADCGADDLRCNAASGQCFQVDQRCDPDGLRSVCAPGSACVADPLDAMRRVCTCAFADPSDFQETNDRHRIPCQPGGTCLQLGNNPGVCLQGR